MQLHLSPILSVLITLFNLSSAEWGRLLEKGQAHGQLVIYEEWQLSFDIQLLATGNTKSWRNILHFGDKDTEVLPGIWFTSGTDYNLYIKTSPCKGVSSWSDAKGIRNLNTGWTTGGTYNVMMKVTNASNTGIMQVYLDGKIAATFEAHICKDSPKKTLYISDPWYTSAQARINNIEYTKINTIEDIDAPTEWGQLITKGQKYDEFQIFDQWQLTFDIQLLATGTITNWRSILHLGDTRTEVLPGIWFTSGTEYNLYIKTSSCSGVNWRDVKGVRNLKTGWKTGGTYNVVIKVTNNSGSGKMLVYLDGKYSGTFNAHICTAAPKKMLYIGDPWYEPAEARINNIEYTRINPISTTSPTTLSTPAPPIKCGNRPIPGSIHVDSIIKSSETTLIIGGTDAVAHSYPWQVSLRYNSNNFHFCGGSIISKKWILTAAHCSFSTKTRHVVVGDHKFGWTWDDSETGVKHVVKNVYKHPQYDRSTISYDFQLLELENSIEMNEHVQPICLPSSDDVYESGSCLVSGWGNTHGRTYSAPDVLQQADLEMMSNVECAGLWGDFINNSMICGGGGDKSSCNGDSGGPLACKSARGHWQLAGVVSWGSRGCPLNSTPSVFGRVSSVLDWIEDVTNENV